MKSICKVGSRLEGFLGHFFLSTAGILTTSPQRPRRPRRHRTAQDSSASTAAQDSPGLLGVHGGAGQPRTPRRPLRHRTAQDSSASTAAQDSPDLVTRATSATALTTALATGFSSNSYVFL